MNLNRRIVCATAAVLIASSCLAADQAVAFECEAGFQLSGTLTTPDKGDGPFPVVLFHSGSGPTDRDGNQGPMRTDLFPELAAALAEQGIASYRYDKRAMPRYAEHFPPLDQIAPLFGLQKFADDAALAIGMLRARAEIDGGRVAMVGHSEGALIALLVGRGESPPDVIACIAGAGRPIAVVMREQIDGQFDAAPEMREQGLADLDRALEAASRGEDFPADLPAWSRPLFNPTTRDLMRDYVNIDPIEVMKAFDGPVLVLNGEFDVQVSPERDAKPLAAAAEGREDGAATTLVIVPGTSHNLKSVSGPAEPGVSGPVVPDAADALVRWCRGVLAPSGDD